MNRSQHPLSSGHPPAWAESWGQDRYGVFVGFRLGEVEHRFRWIPPGTFLMGSPEDEAGRFESEGPQHPVTISQGFWLGETPATQDLWQEVMGENPSRFQSPRRPVELVSWHDCKDFFERLEERMPGLAARLPTEAEWEYACRAGTPTSTYAGNLEIEGDNDAPLLHELGWYGGNSGVDFDLAEGYDSSGWPEKQFDHTTAGTREVCLKRPNPWGLFDILGNIFEWCEDAWDFGVAYPGTNALKDPVSHGGSNRVIRGGSWNSHARSMRAAFRLGLDPGNRFVNLGFRLARGQGAEPGAGRPAGRRTGRPRGEGGEGRAPDRAGAPDAGAGVASSSRPVDERGPEPF